MAWMHESSIFRPWLAVWLAAVLTAAGAARGAQVESSLDPAEITATLARVADWQLENPSKFDPRYWAIAPLYDGLIDASLITGDPRYLAAVMRAGQRINYELGSRKYHADGHAAGHAWLRIYELTGGRPPGVLIRMKEKFDDIVAHPIDAQLKFGVTPPDGWRVTDRWTWSDSLYMAPPTIARLAKIVRDERYLRFVDMEYRAAYDALYDERAHLFYRDARFIEQRTPNGEKVFWSRGNGWVYAGLALLLESLPADYSNRRFYEKLFREMSAAIVEVQQPQGAWYPSLHDPRHVPAPETSGTALFAIGLAWGVRNGVLGSAEYWPAVESAWSAIEARIEPSGAVTAVQPPAREPKPFNSGSTVPYGTGAVLMAGAQIIRTLGDAPSVDTARLAAKATELMAEAPALSTTCEAPCDLRRPAAPGALRTD